MKNAVPLNRLLFALLCASAVVQLSGCGGQPLTKQLSTKPTSAQLGPGDYASINADHPGEEISLYRYGAPGKYTIFEFTSDR